MASTYVNDLRLNELGTGDGSGTWGTTTNTNLELIAEGLSFGTEAITTNADTHTSTVADGATDPARSIYIKYTGTLDSACTITIAPNTLSRLHFIENGTSGSQNIIISQGSGANVTIPPGDVKVVYLDGAGSGAAVVDAFASLSVVDLKVQDDLTVTDDLIVNGDIDLEGSIDVNGTANLDVVDIDGAVDMASTLTVAGAVTGSSSFATAAGGTFTTASGNDLNLVYPDGRSLFFKEAGTTTLTLDNAQGATFAAGATFADGCTITTADNTAQLTLKSTDADANVGPLLVMMRDSSSPADNDILARIDFKGDNDAAEETFFGSINAVATDVSNGAEDAQIKHRVMVNGTVTSMLDLDASGATFGGNIVMPDNAKALFGASSDLQIYHDGSNSYIDDAGTGDLIIRASDDLHIQKYTGETMINCNVDGSVDLYHNNVKKIETTSSGVDITGGFTATAASTITTADNTTQLTLKSTDADANAGPVLDLIRDSSSPAADDDLGRIRFRGDDAAGNEHSYALIQAKIVDTTDGSEGSQLQFYISRSGTVTSAFTLHESEAVFNDGGLDADFRVESDNEANALFVQGSSGNVGIGTNAPSFGTTSSAGLAIAHATRGILRLQGNSAAQALELYGDSAGGTIDARGSGAELQFELGGSEKARLASDGNLYIAKTSDTATGVGLTLGGGGFIRAVRNEICGVFNRQGSDGTLLSFLRSNSGVGAISVTTSGTTYSTTSDIRLKQDIEPLEATDKLMQMNPVSYAWKANPDGPRSMGFIAQEMEAICPDAVSTDGSEEKMMSMDYGRITPILVSALQDAHKKIEELESRIAAMESK
jgi:hypothetical protein